MILNQARPAEVQLMNDEKRLPLRLKYQARELQFEAQTTHAYEGFYPGNAPTPDTERLLLNALRIHSDAFANLRLSIREQVPSGQLRCRVGPDEAVTDTLLVCTAPGRYARHEASGDNTWDLYEAVLQAVPLAPWALHRVTARHCASGSHVPCNHPPNAALCWPNRRSSPSPPGNPGSAATSNSQRPAP